jgi:hypothetical protein
MEYMIVKEVLISNHLSTGRTKHYSNDQLLPAAKKLRIAKFGGDRGYYLYYLDENDEEMTDTYHETIESAMRQAEFEYNIKPHEWSDQN